MTLVLTIYTLSLSLRLIVGEISSEYFKKSGQFSIGFAMAYACLYIFIDGYLWIKNYLYTTYWTLAFIISLLVVHAIVTVKLNMVMNKMTGNFTQEIRSVNCQFFVFLVAYSLRCAEIITL